MIEVARGQTAAALNIGLAVLYWRVGTRIHLGMLGTVRGTHGEPIVVTLWRQLSRSHSRESLPLTQPLERERISLLGIRSALARIAQSVHKAVPDSLVTEYAASDGSKLVVRQRSAQTKIEVTPVRRGTVHPVDLRTVHSAAEDRFGFAEIQVISFADLYAGKMASALDRQIAWDLFDVRYLFRNEGINDSLFQTFLACILSHNRPAHEVLQPRLKDIRQAFEQEFIGITTDEASLDAQVAAREQLISEIRSRLDERLTRFLLLFHELKPTGSCSDFQTLPIFWQSAGS